MAPPRRPIAERLWSKVDCSGGPDACWIWQGAIGSNGYGNIGTGRVMTEHVHRVVYRLRYGEVPPGLFVLHRCDNPRCCNPAHLFLGTHTDNMRDMWEKGRGSRLGCPYQPPDHRRARGPANGAAKLTDEIVREIRRSSVDAGSLARLFGVTRENIYSIRNGKTWRHVA
jgi:hypothetical protein